MLVITDSPVAPVKNVQNCGYRDQPEIRKHKLISEKSDSVAGNQTVGLLVGSNQWSKNSFRSRVTTFA